MPTKQRKIEVHRLTISSLPEGMGYGKFIKRLRGTRPVGKMVMKMGDKSHALNEASLQNNRLRLRFLSYTKGHRPDVLDTQRFRIEENPLRPSQTNVEWTHLLGGKKNNRYVLLIERNMRGIYPTSVEGYIQWAVEQFYQGPEEDEEDQEAVTINLEAEAGPQFLTRLGGLDRVSEATVRIVRPNPGWHDLQTELGEKASESDAGKVDLTMTARRKDSLKKNTGILQWIKEAFSEHELGYAAIKGKRGNQTEHFNTEKLGKHILAEIEIDSRGQVVPDDAWMRLS